MIRKAGGNVTLDCLDLEQQQEQQDGDSGRNAVWHKEGGEPSCFRLCHSFFSLSIMLSSLSIIL